MPSIAATASTYAAPLNTYAKTTLGYSFTVGNPGTSIPDSMKGIYDVNLIYEYWTLPDTATLAARQGTWDRSNFAWASYAIAGGYTTAIDQLIRSTAPYVSYVYVAPGQYSNDIDTVGYLPNILATQYSLDGGRKYQIWFLEMLSGE